MRVIIKGTHTELTPALRTYLEERVIKSLSKLLGSHESDSPLVEVEFERTTRHHQKGYVWRAEANVTFGKHILRAEASGEDPKEAINVLEEEIVQEVKRFKEKTSARSRQGARAIKKRLREE